MMSPPAGKVNRLAPHLARRFARCLCRRRKSKKRSPARRKACLKFADAERGEDIPVRQQVRFVVVNETVEEPLSLFILTGNAPCPFVVLLPLEPIEQRQR